MKKYRGLTVVLAAVFLGLSTVAATAASWEQVSTRHFLFIFEPRDRPYAEELLGFAEEVYDRVTTAFDSYPPVVPCILRGRIDEANGLTMSFPSRIDLYLTAPTDHFLGARTESWLKVLLTHELTHFVHQSMDSGLYGTLSRVFGRDLASAASGFLPGWAIEGPAVYDETVLSEGGRGRNPLFEMFTRAAAEEGSLFSYEQAAYLAPFPPPGRIYVGGYALVDWLETTYGKGTFQRIMRVFLDFPFLGPDAAIRTVTGKDANRVFADMRKAMTVRTAPFLSIPEGMLVTPDGVGNWSHPQPTTRGLYLYRTRPGAFPAIVGWDRSSQKEQVLVAAVLTDAASFSATADGSSVWFSTLRIDDSRPAEERSSADLWLLEVPSGSVRQLTFGAHLWHPAVSENGGTLLAVQGAGPYTRLVAVDRVTGAVRVLYSRAGANVYTPAISPDGKTVAFVLNVRGFQDVYVADLAALDAGAPAVGDPRSPVTDVNVELARPVLGPDPQGEYFPSFADDATLLFSSDRSGSMALYAADLSSGSVTLIQRDPVAVIAGVEDGQELLYASYGGNGYSIKASPLSTLLSEPVTPEAALPYPAPAAPGTAAPADAPSRPFFDGAPAYLWNPTGQLVTTGPGFLDLALGLGAHVEGGSLLGATRWGADAAWLIGLNQPAGGATLSTSIGPVGISTAVTVSYGWDGFWEQATRVAAGAAWNVFDETVRDTASSLVLGVGLTGTSQVGDYNPFTLVDSFNLPAQAWFSYVGIPASVDYAWQRRGGPVDFNPPWAVRARLSGVAWLPFLSLTAFQGEADALLSANFPVSPHSVMKIGIKASQDLGGPFELYLDTLTVPRGIAFRLRTLPGGLLGALDYLVPLGLFDKPLLFGWGLTGAGLGVHVEALADYDLTAGAFSPIPVIFTGMDITLRLSFDGSSIPVGAGVSAAVSLTDPRSFDPARDMSVYLFAGFDSFGDAARKGERAVRVQGR